MNYLVEFYCPKCGHKLDTDSSVLSDNKEIRNSECCCIFCDSTFNFKEDFVADRIKIKEVN